MSKLNNDKIKELLSQTTVDFDMEMEWEGIESKLDQPKKRKSLFWWMTGLGIGIFIGFLSLSIFFSNDKDEVRKKLKNTISESLVNPSEDEDQLVQPTPIVLSNPTKELQNNVQKIEKRNVGVSKKEVVNTATNKKSLVNITRAQEPTINLGPSFSTFDELPKEVIPSLNTNRIDRNTTNPMNSLSNGDRLNTPSIISREQIQVTALNQLPTSHLDRDNLSNRLIDDLSFTSIPTFKDYRSKYFIFADYQVLDLNKISISDNNASYSDLLNEGFQALSSQSFRTGLGYALNDKLRLTVGLFYNQNRSVIKRQNIRTESALIQSDSALVYTNSIGGDFFESGEIIRTTTYVQDLQQFNYTHSIGLSTGGRYSFFRPFYIGVDLDLKLLDWRSGKMLNANEGLVDFKDISASQNLLSTTLSFGISQQIKGRWFLELGVNYSSNTLNLDLETENLGASGIGGNLRLIHRI